jgi:hypothetical protein
MRVRAPSGPVAVTLTNLLTDVERDFFAREAELREVSGRVDVDVGAGGPRRSLWRSLGALAVVASIAGVGSFSIVRFRPEVLVGIVLGLPWGQGASPAPRTPVAPAALAASPAAAVTLAPSPVVTVALVSKTPAATAPAPRRAHHHRASRHGTHARGKHRRS